MSCSRASLSKSLTNNCRASSATLWLVDERCVRDERLENLARSLSVTEAARFARFLRPERRRQYLLGHTLLRLATSRMTGVPVSAIEVTERPGRAPLLSLPERITRPAFSLSHSGHWIACATSIDTAVGLDIEVIDAQRDIIALSEAAFHPGEYEWVKSCSDSERLAAFYRVWTMKEALFKLASERGDTGALPSVVDAHGALRLRGEIWACSVIEHSDLSVSLCSAEAIAAVNQVDVSRLIV
jgi:4'-phosphopantetheinyl transferase